MAEINGDACNIDTLLIHYLHTLPILIHYLHEIYRSHKSWGEKSIAIFLTEGQITSSIYSAISYL